MTTAPKPIHFSWKWRLGAIILFVITTFFAFSLAFPFQPYKYLEFTSIPESACVHEGIVIEAEREIVNPVMGRLTRAEVASTWIEEGTGRTESAGQVPIPIQPTAREVIESPVLRETPPTPGSYYLYIETTVYGYIGFIPRDTTVANTSEYPVEVMDCEEANESE